MNNQIKSSTNCYSASLHQDPYAPNRHIACLADFDSKEMVDGYSIKEIDDMIEFLLRVQTELKHQTDCLHCQTLFSGKLE